MSTPPTVNSAPLRAGPAQFVACPRIRTGNPRQIYAPDYGLVRFTALHPLPVTYSPLFSSYIFVNDDKKQYLYQAATKFNGTEGKWILGARHRKPFNLRRTCAGSTWFSNTRPTAGSKVNILISAGKRHFRLRKTWQIVLAASQTMHMSSSKEILWI